MSISAPFLWSLAAEYGVTLPDNEKWTSIREHRNKLLSACDWTQLPDAPLILGEKQAWAAYRQTIRNIPEDFTSPDAVIFPDEPGAV